MEIHFGFTNRESVTNFTINYLQVASYTKAEIANQVLIEVPEVVIPTSYTNVTEPPRTEPPPDIDEIIAAIDGQKTVNHGDFHYDKRIRF
jgi:hypothetical protein